MWTEALELARNGVAVFPCINRPGDPSDKAPLTPHGFKDATCDPDIVHRWWTRWRNALVGVPAGVRFVAIDLDLRHEDAQRWYDQNRDRLPLTRTHVTRRSGRHLLFKPSSQVGCTVSKLGPHIDTRGLGGYVVWWPACGLELLHAGALAPVPSWVIEKLRSAPVISIFAPPAQQQIHISAGQAKNKLDGIIRTIAFAQEGERNSRTFWGACRMAEMVRAKLLDRSAAISLVIEAASRNGLTRQEALRTAQSAFRERE
jgi:Bifunctional DNA primase/polymerase, N-terminal